MTPGESPLPDGLVHFVYQDRAGDGLPWRILRAATEPGGILGALADAKPSERAVA